jgi:single-stranded-DNA-specific exonuclease
LINRQITSVAQAKMFLLADMASLYNPFLLTDMDRAVARIEQAQKKSEKILIYGDYDVDGVTSSALLRRLFNHLGIQTINYIPHRMEEGYGLNQEVAEFANPKGYICLLPLIAASMPLPIEAINAAGIDVIVIDHHEPDGDKASTGIGRD